MEAQGELNACFESGLPEAVITYKYQEKDVSYVINFENKTQVNFDTKYKRTIKWKRTEEFYQEISSSDSEKEMT